ncbi:hypothetical protein [Urechidicola croceus]|uniref:Cytochrome c domain-containing protein n=1 Tax=Urechidicola croceus TaxID=1850246 RepID=A0A1D8P7F4_9FLAO|nr:hypothetical protein [Urechidicola croceus]AOW20513.1 hypothetical protein LPB138_07415 [Urechidicola croceus]
MNKVLIIFCIVLFASCNNDKKKELSSEKEELVMYQPSELAILMEEMYVLNDSIKSQILRNETPTNFPEKLLNIHTAEMTDRFTRDESFQKFAKVFLEQQQSIYSATNEEIQSNFNNTINTCIACHQTSCTGPIPRIKKLLIK